jgi:hypothetical protein
VAAGAGDADGAGGGVSPAAGGAASADGAASGAGGGLVGGPGVRAQVDAAGRDLLHRADDPALAQLTAPLRQRGGDGLELRRVRRRREADAGDAQGDQVPRGPQQHGIHPADERALQRETRELDIKHEALLPGEHVVQRGARLGGVRGGVALAQHGGGEGADEACGGGGVGHQVVENVWITNVRCEGGSPAKTISCRLSPVTCPL